MKCPKCGQEMLHINNQYICTACGIVANEFSPKSQVLSSIKEKMESAKPAPQEEEYVSPTKVATKEPDAHETVKEQVVESNDSGKTLDQVSRDAMIPPQVQPPTTSPPSPTPFSQAEVPKEQPQNPVDPEPPVETAVPSQASTPQPVPVNIAVGPRFVPEEGERVIPRVAETTPPQTYQEPVAQYVPQGVGEGSIFTPELQPQSIVTDGPSADEVQVGASGSQMIYPSHQISRVLIKVLAAFFVIILLGVGAYFMLSSGAGKGLIDKMGVLFSG